MDDHASSSDCAEDNSLAGRTGEKGCARAEAWTGTGPRERCTRRGCTGSTHQARGTISAEEMRTCHRQENLSFHRIASPPDGNRVSEDQPGRQRPEHRRPHTSPRKGELGEYGMAGQPRQLPVKESLPTARAVGEATENAPPWQEEDRNP